MNGKELIDVKNQIIKTFGKSEWLELGYSIDCQNIVNDHPRLLRSLSFNDDDYEGNALILDSMIRKDLRIWLLLRVI
ncbi:MAG: hypothetical protein IPN08_05455 [Bacteroidales bacterium]|nr:hypothetical protein [Bacteroidales bacterium]